MTRDETDASPFAALFEWERKNSGGGGRAKIQVAGGQPSGSKLGPGGGRTGVRRFHAGHRLAGTKINNIVKVKYVRNNHDAARHIIQHIDYIEKRERDRDEPERKFYGGDGERSRDEVIDSVMKNRGEHAAMFKIILSPKQNELNHILYASEIMRRFEERTGIKTDWSMVEHKNTEHHHVHIVMPGKDMDGRSFRLEQEHLDWFREIANEYQYEIADLDYTYEKQVEKEFGNLREEADLLLASARDYRDMKDLGVKNPVLDKDAKELLQPGFDDVYFRKQLLDESRKEEAPDYKDLLSEMNTYMQEQHPELYPGLQKRLNPDEKDQEKEPVGEKNTTEAEPELVIERSPQLEKLEQIKDEMVDQQVFEKASQEWSSGLIEYLQDNDFDRQYIIDGIKHTWPEMVQDIEAELREANPLLFSAIDKELDLAKQEALERREESQELTADLTKDSYSKESALLLSIAGVHAPFEKPAKEPLRADDRGDSSDDPEKGDDDTEQLLDKADDAIAKAENLKTGKEWAGLMAFQDPAFIDEPLDLTAEVQALMESQQSISNELNELEADVMVLDPNLFKLQETLDDVKHDLDDIDKEDEGDRSL